MVDRSMRILCELCTKLYEPVFSTFSDFFGAFVDDFTAVIFARAMIPSEFYRYGNPIPKRETAPLAR